MVKQQFWADDRDVPNEITRKVIEDAHNGVGLSRPFSSMKELMDELNAED